METETSRLTVDPGAIAANWAALCAHHPGGAVAGVVKADAYGLGAAIVAPALFEAGCRHFFTAHLAEAAALRPHLPGAMIAVLNGLITADVPDYLAHDILPVLGSLAEIEVWETTAHQAARRLPALLHVDTGMNRLGLAAAELDRLAAAPERLTGIDLRYVMTHLVASECLDDPINTTQRTRFAAACARLPAAPRSLANSSGMFLGADFASDLARPGAALYGINPTPGQPNPMRIPLRLEARVLRLRTVGTGAGVGYNATWRAARPSRIATAAIGYADGWPRSLSGRGHAVFDGRPLPLVGRISMDLATYDATDHPTLRPGDWLTLMGPDLPPDTIAAWAGTNAYEILTSLGPRHARHTGPA